MVRIRAARPGDEVIIFDLLMALADYERLTHEVDATPAKMAEVLFAGTPRAFCEIAEADGEPVGLAIWFYTFATFRGKHGIYLEDLFVRPEQRGQGIGGAARPSRPSLRRRGSRPARMVGSRLERTGDRILPLARGRSSRRLDHVPGRRRRIARPWRIIAPAVPDFLN